jgi:hypothetical protein
MRNLMKHNKFVFEDMVLYIYKGYMALSTFENIWL